MKKTKKIFVASILAAAALQGTLSFELTNSQVAKAEEVQQGTWIKSSDGRWWYKYQNGSYPTGWAKISNAWYYFDSSGWMQTGWVKPSDGKWYYLNSSGVMLTGWQNISNTWYYLNTSGDMATGWIQPDGRWFYLNSSGAMQTGYQRINGIDYNFSSNGNLLYSGDLLVTVLANDYTRYGNDTLNTNGDVDSVSNIFSGTSYTVQGIKNATKNDIFRVNSYVNQKNINSGIFLYSGHGSEDSSMYLGNRVWVEPYEIKSQSMNNTNVAFFFNCYGAKASYSLLDAAVNAGAKAAYGYTNISYLNEDHKLQQDILRSMLNGDSLYTAVEKAKALNSTFTVVNDKRILLKGNVNVKLPTYNISKEVGVPVEKLISQEKLQEFKIDGNIATRYYNGVLTSDSFYLDENGDILVSKLDLLNEDLSRLDSVISEKNEGAIYDESIESNLNSEEKLINKYTVIAKLDGKVRLLRNYYIEVKTEGGVTSKKVCIDVETGQSLSDNELESLYN